MKNEKNAGVADRDIKKASGKRVIKVGLDEISECPFCGDEMENDFGMECSKCGAHAIDVEDKGAYVRMVVIEEELKK